MAKNTGYGSRIAAKTHNAHTGGHMGGKTVYISGAIMYATGPDLFAEAEQAVRDAGNVPVNPKRVGACPDRSCTRLPHELEKGMEHSWSCYMRYDLIAMLECDRILMLPGWEASHGARLEYQVAIACGIPTYEGVPLEAEPEPERRQRQGTHGTCYTNQCEHLGDHNHGPDCATDCYCNAGTRK